MSRLAVPSPGKEIGQRLEHPLPVEMEKCEMGGVGTTSTAKARSKPSSAVSASCSLTKHSESRTISKSVLHCPGEHPGQKETDHDRPHEGKAPEAVGSQEGFLEEKSSRF